VFCPEALGAFDKDRFLPHFDEAFLLKPSEVPGQRLGNRAELPGQFDFLDGEFETTSFFSPAEREEVLNQPLTDGPQSERIDALVEHLAFPG
jgi:hypothetical protein